MVVVVVMMLACDSVLHEKHMCLPKLEIWPSAVSSFYRQLLDEFEISPDDECFKVHGKKVCTTSHPITPLLNVRARSSIFNLNRTLTQTLSLILTLALTLPLILCLTQALRLSLRLS